MRDRHARVIAYEVTRADRAATLALQHQPDPGCPDCTAGPGEFCDPWCLRFREDPDD